MLTGLLIAGVLVLALFCLSVSLGALCGFAWFLVRFAGQMLPMANMLAALDKTNTYMDDRIRDILSRAKPPKQPEAQMPRNGKVVLDDEEEASREAERKMEALGRSLLSSQPDMEG